MNYNTTNDSNQPLSSKNFTNAYSSLAAQIKSLEKRRRNIIDKDPIFLVVDNPREAVDSLTPSQRNVFLLILKLILRYNLNTYVSQSKIAKRLGIARETVNRCCSLLAEMGLISKEYRGVKKTCLYRLTSYYRQEDRAKTLFKIFLSPKTVFSVLLLTVLGVSHNTIPINIVTQHNKRIMNLNNSFYTPSKTATNIQRKYGLSQAALFKLSIFPESAIQSADEKLCDVRIRTVIRNPFAFLIKEIKDYCDRESFKPDWRIYYHLMETNKLDLNASAYENHKPFAKTQTSRVFYNPKRGQVDKGFSIDPISKPELTQEQKDARHGTNPYTLLEKRVEKDRVLEPTVKMERILSILQSPIKLQFYADSQKLSIEAAIDKLKEQIRNLDANTVS